MVANRRNLTDTRIDALSGDGHRRPEVRDLEVPGLIVRAAANPPRSRNSFKRMR